MHYMKLTFNTVGFSHGLFPKHNRILLFECVKLVQANFSHQFMINRIPQVQNFLRIRKDSQFTAFAPFPIFDTKRAEGTEGVGKDFGCHVAFQFAFTVINKKLKLK